MVDGHKYYYCATIWGLCHWFTRDEMCGVYIYITSTDHPNLVCLYTFGAIPIFLPIFHIPFACPLSPRYIMRVAWGYCGLFHECYNYLTAYCSQCVSVPVNYQVTGKRMHVPSFCLVYMYMYWDDTQFSGWLMLLYGIILSLEQKLFSTPTITYIIGQSGPQYHWVLTILVASDVRNVVMTN